jgi:hypothetical protein
MLRALDGVKSHNGESNWSMPLQSMQPLITISSMLRLHGTVNMRNEKVSQ